MRLSQHYQPETQDDVVGQPAIVRRLKTLVLEPYPCCGAFTGPGGVGRSAAAKALIHDLGVSGGERRTGALLTRLRESCACPPFSPRLAVGHVEHVGVGNAGTEEQQRR